MRNPTVLVIDDSATIRRLVDSTLSAQGYHVVLASRSDDGLKLAHQLQPDVILLDHQLPGTMGTDVCRKLSQHAALARVPIVVSSTLRKRAYLEYADFPNVVDLLPKPYNSELLTTTIANALETAAIVVDSQVQGTAVPEVLEDPIDADLAGVFRHVSLRELLDFLNHGEKRGALEVELEHQRVVFHLDRGRIQGVLATGIDPREVADHLPEHLRQLAPVLNLTARQAAGGELDGLVQLLDNRVVDPRLLRMLLRHQAAMLTLISFTRPVRAFRFDHGRSPPQLMTQLPLDSSLLALLVEGALRCDQSLLPEIPPDHVYARRTIRGQNLDRAGLSAQHIQLLTQLNDPHGLADLAEQCRLEPNEVRRAMFGMALADLVETRSPSCSRVVVVLEPDPLLAEQLRTAFAGAQHYQGRVVRDLLALQLVLKRCQPAAFVFHSDNGPPADILRKLLVPDKDRVTILIVPDSCEETSATAHTQAIGLPIRNTLRAPYHPAQLLEVLDKELNAGHPAT